MEKIGLSHSWLREQVFPDIPAIDGIGRASADVTDPGYDHGYGDRSGLEARAADDGSLGDYEALAATNKEQGDGRLHGTPLFAIPGQADRYVSASARSGSQQGLSTFDPDIESVEQFSITHANWGFIEVDSRRAGVSWNVVVRCSEADTRYRLKSREPEFADMLKRDFGVSLELDVQAAVRP